MRIRPLFVVLGIVILALGAGSLWIWRTAARFEEKISGISIGEVDLATVADGVYEGKADAEIVRAEVQVTVRDHRITAIELTRHDSGRGGPAEAITEHVVAAQSLKVDVIGGATYSSKVILKAIENALRGT